MMGNRPHPHRREDDIAMQMAIDPDFQAACDAAYLEGSALERKERAERIALAETSEEQREWEGHDEGCESEFITEAGMWSPCQCGDRDGD